MKNFIVTKPSFRMVDIFWLVIAIIGVYIISINSITRMEWGIYNGWQAENIALLAKTVGKSPDIVAVFVHFGNENQFPMYLSTSVRERGKTLAIFWEYTDYNVTSVDQPKFSDDAMIRGDWDAYMKSFALSAKNYGGPIILIPFSEMNADWFSWSGTQNGNSPAKTILAFRHMHNLFSDAKNVKFGFAPNQKSSPNTPENGIEFYYPGDEYVDYVGVDGFNFGGTEEQSFDDLFGSSLKTLSIYDKPIYIFSMATVENENKAEWIKDAFTKQIPKYPKIAGWIWFNENKERDWRVDSSTSSLKAFKEILP